METTFDFLVVILSAALAIFLFLAIIAVIKCIQVLNKLKRITDKAESLADKAESVSEMFTKAAAPLAIGRLLARMADTIFSKQKRNARKE